MRDARAAAARPRLAWSVSVSSKGCFGCRRGTGRAQRVVLKNTSGWIRTSPRASSQGRTSLPTGQGRGHFRAGQSFVSVRVSAIERSYAGAFSPRGPNAGARAVRAGERREARRRGQVDAEVLFQEPEEQSVLVGTPVLAYCRKWCTRTSSFTVGGSPGDPPGMVAVTCAGPLAQGIHYQGT